MIVPTEKDIGRKVIYTAGHGEREHGVITGIAPVFVFVRFGSDYGSKATRPADLDWAPQQPPKNTHHRTAMRRAAADAPLKRGGRGRPGQTWQGQTEFHYSRAVNRALDAKYLEINMEADPTGNTATVTAKGKEWLAATERFEP